MKLTISNKTINHKPLKGTPEVGKYFKDLSFTTVECNEEQLRYIIENGYTITYNYSDTTFNYSGYKKPENYIGTQYICVDVDESDLTAEEIIDRMKYKPTFYHTTFSHKRENKNYKNCYHFVFVLTHEVLTESNFNKLFNIFSDGIEYDKQAKDCHRVIFTNHKSNEFFEYKYLGSIYNPNELLNTNITTPISFSEFISNSSTDCLKNEISNKYTSHTDLLENHKNRQIECEKCILTSNDFNLDPEFFNDLNSMSRGDFIMEYCDKYRYYTHTQISSDMFSDGYADLRGIDYYEVPSAQYTWNKELGKATIKKVENGHRDSVLFIDGIAFMHIIPNITKEELVYCMIREVYQNFLNGDKEFNNLRIVNKAKQIWTNINKLSITPIKKSFKIDNAYWIKHGISPKDAVSMVRKQIKDTDLGSVYDLTLTIEKNLEEFKLYGIKCTKKRLIQWCEENDIEYVTDKEYRNSLIEYYYKENNKRSIREISKLLKDNHNVSVGKDTVSKVITNLKIK